MVAVFFVCFLSAEKWHRRTAEQRAVNLLAQFLQRHFAQPKKFAVKNGKGVEEGEGDDFDPEQRQDRHRMVVGAMGQMPVLGTFAKGIVIDPPAQLLNDVLKAKRASLRSRFNGFFCFINNPPEYTTGIAIFWRDVDLRMVKLSITE